MFIDVFTMHVIKKVNTKSFPLQEVIDMFGRYPQRNKALGRKNTPEEEEFLKNIPDRYKW